MNFSNAWHHPWSIPPLKFFFLPHSHMSSFIIPEKLVPTRHRTAHYVSVVREKQVDYSKNSFSCFQKQFKRANKIKERNKNNLTRNQSKNQKSK